MDAESVEKLLEEGRILQEANRKAFNRMKNSSRHSCKGMEMQRRIKNLLAPKKIPTKKTRSDAIVPYKAHVDDAAYDLATPDNFQIFPQETKLIKLGFCLEIPKGYYGAITCRSGLALKKQISVLNSVGIVDPGFRDEIGVILFNHSKKVVDFKKGDRIAQLLIRRCISAEFVEVEKLSDSERGTGGFGSTGS